MSSLPADLGRLLETKQGRGRGLRGVRQGVRRAQDRARRPVVSLHGGFLRPGQGEGHRRCITCTPTRLCVLRVLFR